MSGAPLCLLLICACVLGAGASRAEDPDAAHRCSSVLANAARLACYDAAFGVATSAPQHTFGDTGRMPAEVKAKEAHEVSQKTLDAKVRAVSALPHGLYRLTLDNDQVWVTTDADWTVEFHFDDSVTVSRMPLGGYQISLHGRGKSVGARRQK